MDLNQNSRDSVLCRLLAATQQSDQPVEEKNVTLVVSSIRHYVLDLVSRTILFNNDHKNKILPFDGYDLVITDGKYQTICALAEVSLSEKIQKNILKPGSVFSRVVVRLCFSERVTRHPFFLIIDCSLDTKKRVAFDNNLPWLPGLDAASQNLPVLCKRSVYIPLWNITDPAGACWDNATAVSRTADLRTFHQTLTLRQIIFNNPGKNTPLLVRVFAKSRLDFYARKGYKHRNMDTTICPYKFDILVSDGTGCCLAIFWQELAVQAYNHINVGSILLIRWYRVKQSYKTIETSACCFDDKIERFKYELSIDDKSKNGLPQFEIVEPVAITGNPRCQLPEVPFNFIPFSSLNSSSVALDGVKMDAVGAVLYVGRWNREARRRLRQPNENEQPSDSNGSVIEGMVVTSLTGNKSLEEFHTGGYWMWRWIVLADDSYSIVRIKCFCSSQPDAEYNLQPADVVAITQLRFLVFNKHEATNSRFTAKWALTTTNESQLVILSNNDIPSFSNHPQVASVRRFAESLPADLSKRLTFGGIYDFPSCPDKFESFVQSYQSLVTIGSKSPASPTDSTAVDEDGLQPFFLAAPQFEALSDHFAFLEQRCLVLHGLFAFVKFIPFDEVIAGASLSDDEDVTRNRLTSPVRKSRRLGNTRESLQFTLAAAWNERRMGFRGIGIETPQWRTLAWHWQNKHRDRLLQKYVNLPGDAKLSTADSNSHSSPSGSRLHLNPFRCFVGFLQVQLLLLNQSIYINALVPVPGSCCNEETFSRTSNEDPLLRMVNFINECCDNFDLLNDETSNEVSVNPEKVSEAIRELMSRASAAKSLAPNRALARLKAVVNCYGLGEDGIEISIKKLYIEP